MKITKPVFLYGEQSDYCLLQDGKYGPGIRWTATGNESTLFGALATQIDVTFDLPDAYDPRPGMIALLRAQQQELRARVEAEVNKIDERIASLLAVENNA